MMNTMNTVTVITTAYAKARVEKARKAVKALSKAVNEGVEYNALPRFDYHLVYDLMDLKEYDKAFAQFEDEIWALYNEYNCASDEAYRREAEPQFLKYFVDGEPSADVWEGACLSDWHKDIYGFRPRGKERIDFLVSRAQRLLKA